MSTDGPELNQLNLVVSDMAATLAFYRLLGLTIAETLPEWEHHHRNAVDETFGRIVAAGHRAQQSPYDAFWGARYAIVEDPDGNAVGLMSPIDEARRTAPPTPPR